MLELLFPTASARKRHLQPFAFDIRISQYECSANRQELSR